MTCRELVDFLADYLDGTLPVAERSTFEEHLAECPACVAYLNTYQSGVELVQKLAADESCPLPDELVRAILAARNQ